MRTLLKTKQKEGESLQDYTKRFRVAPDVLKSHIGGPIILTKFIEAMDGYNKTDIKLRDKIRKQASVNLWPIYTSITQIKQKWINYDRAEHSTVTWQRSIPE